MAKTLLNFNDLDSIEKEFFLNDSWCNNCGKADLGIINPVLYKENGKTYLAGKCKVCGEPQLSEVIRKNTEKSL